MKHTKTILITVIILLLIAAIVVYLLRQSNYTDVDWELYGTWICEDETITDQIIFSVSGMLPKATIEDEPCNLSLDFRFPEDFRYAISTSNSRKPGIPAFARISNRSPQFLYFEASCSSYDKNENIPIPVSFLICEEKGFIVINWYGRESNYFVASTNPETDPMEVYDFFRLFRETTDLGASAPVDIPT